ncbi:MAG: response regulator [archaeon]|nr:response regulator [archaeon]
MKDKYKILLIDDEPDINFLASTSLKIGGFEVHSCFNGLDGISAAEDQTFDLVLLDINMPDMSGYEVIEILKTIDNMKNTPIVFFSASVQNKDLEEAKKYTPAGYIKKPFDPIALPDEVKKFLK